MNPKHLTLACAAIRLVCAKFGITTEQLEGRERTAHLCLARQLVMFYCVSLGMKHKHIGPLLGKVKSDVYHACRAFQDRLDTEPKVIDLWNWLQSSIQP